MLAVGQLVTSLAFGLLALSYSKSTKMADAYRALAMMFGIPMLFLSTPIPCFLIFIWWGRRPPSPLAMHFCHSSWWRV
jgi:hypothetical protein